MGIGYFCGIVARNKEELRVANLAQGTNICLLLAGYYLI